MIKAIIFDCFGVLITDGLEVYLTQREAKEPDFNRAPIVGMVDKASVGLISLTESRQAVADYLGLSLDEYIDIVASGEVKNRPLFAYIHELRPNYKTALLSNIGRDGLKNRFEPAELTELFDVVVISGEVGIAKPDPEVYQLTADKLGVKVNECIFLDDRQDYVDGAVSTGMPAILYQNFAQAKADLEQLLAN